MFGEQTFVAQQATCVTSPNPTQSIPCPTAPAPRPLLPNNAAIVRVYSGTSHDDQYTTPYHTMMVWASARTGMSVSSVTRCKL